MNATDDAVVIDQERAAITARSTVANLDVLAEEGLTQAEQVRSHAEVLGRETGVAARESAEHARALRELLAELTGPTSTVLVTWLDDALGQAD